MTRPIKFRAWDADVKRFITDGNLCLTMDGELCGWLADKGQYDIEQFTGLLDKNGKAIYEGDILQYPNEQMKPVVRFGEYSLGSYDTFEEGVGFFLELDGVQYCSLSRDCNKNLKVIGNIHENPGLLK